MPLSIQPPYAPMEARLVGTIPQGDGWQYEPKWDGFRCLVFKDGDRVDLQSKSCQPLGRYFPEVVAEVRGIPAGQFVLDGELAIPMGDRLSFDDLLQRIHPAESRVRKLAEEHPALFIAFDLLVDADNDPLASQPLRVRRERLERFMARCVEPKGGIRLSPATTDLRVAHRWFESVGGSLDGVIAKRLECAYRTGERDGMQKVKAIRTADCVVGGFRYASRGKVVGSMLLGLYDEAGLLHHVGFTSAIRADERPELTRKLEALVEAPGFTGRAPGGPSRWSTERTGEWCPLRPELVVEVTYDHFTGGRFRHGTQILRWRPDKAPRQCTLDQVRQGGGRSLALLDANSGR